MKYAGEPHTNLRVVHVAGTNGKGSTCSAIASVLTSAGFNVGLYTSPHMVSFTERIKIGGKQIPEKDVVALTGFFQPAIMDLKATFFEATTAMMFKYFADEGVDFAVIETGLGGRLDSTNIVDPLISVITGIGLDHTEILGRSINEIAGEKAGIIKSGRPAVANVESGSLREVFNKVSADRGSDMYFVQDVAKFDNLRADADNSVFDATVFGTTYPDLKVGLGGRHQIGNALTALTTLHLMAESGIEVPTDAVYEGMEKIGKNTGHRGRFDILSRDPLIILDVAHNPDAMRALIDGCPLLSDTEREGVLLFAAMRDKDAATMLTILHERIAKVILTQLQTGRSLNVAELKKLSEHVKLNSQVFDNSSEALRFALTQINNDRFLLITGSHYLAGEILPILEKRVLTFESL